MPGKLSPSSRGIAKRGGGRRAQKDAEVNEKLASKKTKTNSKGSKQAAGKSAAKKSTAGSAKRRYNHPRFSDKELDYFKKLLLEKREEIQKELTGLRKKIQKALAGELLHERNSGDPDSDLITETTELAKDEQLVAQLERNLKLIDEALQAIEDGTYGFCRRTGKPISKERLKAIPWAKYSFEAQQEIDASRGI